MLRSISNTLSGIALTVLILAFAPIANAQTSYEGLNHINRIIQGAPSVSTVNISGNVAATASGPVTVRTPSGFSIPVPTSATATVPKAAVAKAAAKFAARAVPFVGTGFAAYDLYNEIKNSGIQTCPPPDFFCRPSVPTTVPNFRWTPAGYGGWHVTPELAAEFASKLVCQANTSYSGCYVKQLFLNHAENATAQIEYNVGLGKSNTLVTIQRYVGCPDNYALSNGVCTYTGTVQPGGKYTEAELEQALLDKINADSANSKRYYDALRADNARNRMLQDSEIVDPATPVVYNAPPVTTTERVVSTQTFTNPDGTTSTQTTKETVKVTPTTSGTTVGTGSITFPSQTTTTTTTVNNTTNNTTTTTTVVNNEPAIAEPAPLEIPNDYNKEATQQKILDELKGPTTAPPVTPDVVAKTKETDDQIKAEFDKLPNQQTSDKSNWFSWVWTPPVGQCVASAGAAVRGLSVSYDGGGIWCDWVEKIRDVIGFLFALGGAWYIYNLMFTRGD